MSTRETEPAGIGPTGSAPVVALSIFLMVLGGLAYMHPGILGAEAEPVIAAIGPAALLIGLVPFGLALLFWGRSDIRFDAAHPDFAAGKAPEQRTAMIMFLLSETFFFFGFFWAFVRFGVDPEIAGSSTWPPLGIVPEDPWGTPLVSTIILVVSGLFAVAAHHLFLAGRRQAAAATIGIAVVLGIVFLGIQVREFLTAPFAYTDGSYASLFFLAVGFHGLHVFIGATLLAIAAVRLLGGSFEPRRHFGLEASIWYWHFVDAVWLFLFMVFYWWPTASIAPPIGG
jgi:heme/copper-type cytochrome/quinol oxidase subunit 3